MQTLTKMHSSEFSTNRHSAATFIHGYTRQTTTFSYTDPRQSL